MDSGIKYKFLVNLDIATERFCNRRGMYDSCSSINEIEDVDEMERLSACRLMHVSVNRVPDISSCQNLKMSKLQMFSDQKSCDGDILDEAMARESGQTYLNLRCDDTRKISIEQMLIDK